MGVTKYESSFGSCYAVLELSCMWMTIDFESAVDQKMSNFFRKTKHFAVTFQLMKIGFQIEHIFISSIMS